MKYQNILVEQNDRILTITINRQDKLNALNHGTLAELGTAFSALEKDDSIGGVLLTGAGDKAFVAGADISEIQSLDHASGKEFARFGQKVFAQIENCTKPVIALVNGFALGGGCELAMACHMRIASESAKFGQPEVNLGLIPGYGGTQRLARLVGKGRALELILSGNMIDATRAYEIGLVNSMVPESDLTEAGLKLLGTILKKAPLATHYVLETVQRGMEKPLELAIELEAEFFGKACASEDMKEGTSAFLEKRKPDFQGK
jgi:enoyl-CoA hydratase